MPSAVCQRHGVALHRVELVGTMKRLLACLALCASLCASAQDDNCALLNIQGLVDSIAALNTALDQCGADLSGADLSHTSLAGADLSNANLTYADLSYSMLGGVDFSNANLTYANLSGSVLQEADLSGADLTYANLNTAQLLVAVMTCLLGCPSSLPSDYICEPDPDCQYDDRYRIVYQPFVVPITD